MLCSGSLEGTGKEPIFRGKMIPFEIAELEVIHLQKYEMNKTGIHGIRDPVIMVHVTVNIY